MRTSTFSTDNCLFRTHLCPSSASKPARRADRYKSTQRAERVNIFKKHFCYDVSHERAKFNWVLRMNDMFGKRSRPEFFFAGGKVPLA